MTRRESDVNATVEAQTGAAPPAVEVRATSTGEVAVLSGSWTLRGLGGRLDDLRATLRRIAAQPGLAWDLSDVTALDTAGALILWRVWNRTLPDSCRLPDRHRRLFDYWIQQDTSGTPPERRGGPAGRRALAALAAPARAAVDHAAHGSRVLGNFVIDTAGIVGRPARAPWRELSATIYLVGLRALPITGLVGVLVGIVVAYLSALQLRTFGADQLIVDMLGYAVVRELGPLLGAIIVAGRSGSSLTAEIGVMRLAQELDAMEALGMSISRRVVWPKVVALTAVMPLVVLWTILTALAGGIAATQVTLDLNLEFFIARMPDSVPTANLWIGLGKAVVFGAAVGFTASYFGLRTRPNTLDLGAQTTRAVVVAITLVILIDAVFAILLQSVGF